MAEPNFFDTIPAGDSKPVPVSEIRPIIGPQKDTAAESRAQESLDIQRSGEARQQRGEQRDIEQRTFERSGKLYDQYVGRTAVKMYEQAWPAFTSALSQPDTTQGNRALIYNAIKIFDPEGAVPTGDIEGIESSSPILQRIIRSSGRLLDQGGNLPPEQRKELLDALNQRVSTLRGPYNLVRSDFERRSRNIGIDPLDTIGSPIDQADANIYQEWLKKQQPTAAGAAGEGPRVSVTPEESISLFGQFTGGTPGYDAQGNIVGRAYAEAGNQIYDANGRPVDVGLFGTVTDETLNQPAPSFFGGIARDVGEAITGSERSTATIEALPDWTQMPEFNNLLSSGTWKTAFGTAFGGGPQEIAQIVQSNFPDTKVYQDEKGNYILQSGATGQRYAIKPGFRLSDIPRALNTIALGGGGRGASVAQTALREGALQTGIEATQGGVGGTFNPEDIAAATVLGGGMQKLTEVLPQAVQVARNLRRSPNVATIAPEVSMELPGGIPLPSGRVSEAPVGGASTVIDDVTGETVTVPRDTSASMMGSGGLSSAPTSGTQPLQFSAAPADILSRSGTRSKPGTGVLNDADISDRDAVLDALGLPRDRRRLGAQTGNEAQINDEVMISKLGEGSERMIDQFDLESRHLGEYALDLIDRTGGTLNLDAVNRGAAIVKPLEDYQAWYKAQIGELYKQADQAAAASGVPITLQELNDALRVDSTFASKSGLITLRNGIRKYLKEINAVDKTGKPLPLDTIMAEKVRQYLNDNWTPENSAVIGKLKASIDNDVLSALPADVYANARQMRANYADIFEKPEGLAKILEIDGPEGINRRIPLDQLGDRLTNWAQKNSAQFNNIVNTLENMPTPVLQQQGRQAVGEIRANLLENILKKNVDFEDISQGGDAFWRATDKSLGSAMTPYKGKLADLFGPEIADRIETLRVGARILRPVDPNPSGTATATTRLVGKTREALLRSAGGGVGGSLGTLVGGPAGAAIGGITGERIGAKMVQRAEVAARERAISSSLDDIAKAKKLAKMRSRRPQQ